MLECGEQGWWWADRVLTFWVLTSSKNLLMSLGPRFAVPACSWASSFFAGQSPKHLLHLGSALLPDLSDQGIMDLVYIRTGRVSIDRTPPSRKTHKLRSSSLSLTVKQWPLGSHEHAARHLA